MSHVCKMNLYTKWSVFLSIVMQSLTNIVAIVEAISVSFFEFPNLFPFAVAEKCLYGNFAYV